MVIILASGPEVRGLVPTGVDGFFQSVKILTITSFGREVKPWVPCRAFTARKKNLKPKLEPLSKNLSDFSRTMSEATLMT